VGNAPSVPVVTLHEVTSSLSDILNSLDKLG
jgi:hypothetical protein